MHLTVVPQLRVGWLANNPKLAAVCKKSKNKKWGKKISHLHNANIYPIRHATIAGTIWYQGCSNVKYGFYGTMLNGLIKSWRAEFDNPEMPFYIVQIAPHTYAADRGAYIRSTQDYVAAHTKNCELVVTNDQNQIPGDIHPPKKADVAHRLAQCALGAHYGKTTAEFRSPAYKSMTVEGNTIRVSFKNVPATLVKKGEGRINGFQVGVQDPENDKLFVFSVAEAKIEGNEVVVWAEGVKNPVAVRYCYNEDMGNVFSAEGLPLAPFRSDKGKSLSARPYIETPSQIAIAFEGEGFSKTSFTEGASLWADSGFVLSNILPKEFEGFVLSNILPKEFEGFEMMMPAPVEKGAKSRPATITAQADGKIYIFTGINKDTRKAPWHVLTSSYTTVAREGKLAGTFYIIEREVKAGDVVEIPVFESRWGVGVLAKTIE